MRKNIFKNLFLSIALALFAVVVSAKGIDAAKTKNQYNYGENVGTEFRFETSTKTFKSGSSHIEVDLRAIALTDANLLTSLKVEGSVNGSVVKTETAAISGSTDEVLIEGFTMRVSSTSETSITFFYKTTKSSVEKSKTIALNADKFVPSFEKVTANNTKPVQKIVADLEILEVQGLKTLEYLVVPTGETTIGKTWVTHKNYAHEIVYDNIVEQIEVTGLTDGDYDLYVRASDYAGNETEETVIGTYTVDTTAPLFKTELTVPTDWTNNGEITLPLTTDGTITYSINGGAAIKYTSLNNVITVTADGENKILITATDEAGNVTTKEFTLKLDTTKPEVNATITGGDASTGSGYKIEIAATDATSGISKILYSIDGGKFQEYTAAIELPLTTEKQEIAYCAFDNAGNESETKTIETGSVESLGVTVELKKELTSTLPFESTEVTVLVDVKASVGIKSIKYSNSKTPDNWVDVDLTDKKFLITENGSYIVKVETVVGTEAEETLVVTEIDKVVPVLENLTVDVLKNKATVKFDYSDDYSGVFYIGVLVCAKTDTNCEFFKENANYQKVYVIVDDDSLLDYSDLDATKLEVLALTGFKGLEIEFDKDGEYNVHVAVADFAGNCSAVLKENFLVDTVAPTAANISRNIQDEVSKNDYIYTITGTATDTLSGMKEEYVVIYTFDTSGKKIEKAKFTDLTNAITITEEGKYEFYYHAADNAGNVTSVSEVFIIDRTAPEFTVTFNVAEETWTNKLEMDIKASNLIDAETVDTIKWGYALEGQTITLTETLEEFQKVELDLVNGRYIFKVEVTDMSGNVRDFESGVYYVDVVKPVVTINTELADKLFNGLVEVNVSLADADSGIDKVSYNVFKDGAPISSSTNIDAMASFTFNVPFAEEGTYTIAVALKDKAGNVMEVESGSFRVDLKAPVIEGLNETGYHSTKVTVSVNDISDVEIKLNGEEVTGTEFEVTESGYYQLTATDELGQKSVKLFVVNLKNKLALKNKDIDVLTQRYLPIVKDGEDFYVNIPAGSYGLKNVLVLTAEKDGFQAKLDQSENYIYLKSNVNKAVVENGYRIKVKDASIITEEDENGYYGYVVVSAVTTEEALDMDIEVVVIDNEGLALGLGVAGTVALVGLFFVSRGKKTLKV